MAWVRTGESPEQIKVSFIVSVKEHPELARFILGLPYRSTSKTLRDILSDAGKAAEGASGEGGESDSGDLQAESPRVPRDKEIVAGSPPNTEAVSAAAAGIIEKFDRMFPS